MKAGDQSGAGTKVRVSLIFVTRNEVLGLRSVFGRVPLQAADEVFAIDARSTDGTVEFFREKGIAVYFQKEKGLGAAMLEGRVRTSTDAMIFFHPDGNEDPGDIPKFVSMLNEGAQFIVASRMIPGARNEEDKQIFRWRKWANKGLGLIANTLFSRDGVRSSDITNGFRAITCEAFDRMCLTSKDASMDFQMIIRALKLGLPIMEFPTFESRRIGGKSNFPSFQTGLLELRLIWREYLAGDTVFERSNDDMAM